MFDFSAMASLAVCERCRHGIPFHDGGGCRTLGCRCDDTRESTIESAIMAAREEQRAHWDASLEQGGRA